MPYLVDTAEPSTSGKQIALHAFARDAGAAPFAALRDLVDLVDEDDAVLLAVHQRLRLDLLVVDQLAGFLFDQQRPRLSDRELALLAALARERLEHAAQLAGHFLHAGRRHDLDTDVLRDVDLDLAIVERALAQLLAQLLARVGVARIGRRQRLVGEADAGAARQQRIENAILRAIVGLRAHARLGLLARHLDRAVGEIAHDLLDVLADVADLGELGRLDLDERRIRERGEPARDLGLADAGRADHQDVLRRDLVAQNRFELHAPPAIAQRDRDRALGGVLADDVAIELVDDFAGCEFGHIKVDCGMRRRFPPPSFRRKPESILILSARRKSKWVPAFAGKTALGRQSSSIVTL